MYTPRMVTSEVSHQKTDCSLSPKKKNSRLQRDHLNRGNPLFPKINLCALGNKLIGLKLHKEVFFYVSTLTTSFARVNSRVQYVILNLFVPLQGYDP